MTELLIAEVVALREEVRQLREERRALLDLTAKLAERCKAKRSEDRETGGLVEAGVVNDYPELRPEDYPRW